MTSSPIFTLYSKNGGFDTFAVSMLDAGEDIKSLQENLGHATAAFTLNQYAHVSKKMRMQTSQRMHEYFTKLMPAASM